MRIAILEIRMGRNFDEAWIAMRAAEFERLERIFIIILDEPRADPEC